MPTSHIVLRGQGMDRTTLDFTNQTTGAQGILGTADGFVIENLHVLNPKGDGVRVEGADGVIFQSIRVDWNTEPDNLHGAYGIDPVQCRNVLIDDSEVTGSSDAGIYVGQSEHVIVRRSRAFENVAGIEIENTIDADVYLNVASNNTGGLLIFDNPGLQHYGCRAHTDPAKDQPNCRGTRAWANWIIDNNHENFANGGTVALVPPGTGVIIMATDTIELFNNVIKNHQTVNSVVISYRLTGLGFDPVTYNPYPERIEIFDNEFADGGYFPVGDLGQIMSLSFNPPGTPEEEFVPIPDVLYENVYLDPTLRIALNPNPPPPRLRAARFGRGLRSAGVNWDAFVVDCPNLSDYRLYQDPTEPRSAPNAGGTPFDLTTPLFSDYAQKDRIVYLPPGTQASYSEHGVFELPVGTIISKTFSFGHDLRSPNAPGSDIVETRS